MSKKEYLFDQEKGVVFDFLTFLNQFSRYPSVDDIYKDLGFFIPDIVFESYKSIISKIRNDFVTALLFPRGSGKISFLYYVVAGPRLLDFYSIDDVIGAFLSVSQEDLKIKLLEFYGSDNRLSETYYKQLLANPEALTDFVNGLDYDSGLKWNLITFLNSHRPLADDISKALIALKTVFEAEYEKHRRLIKNGFDSIVSSCGGNPDKLLRGKYEAYDVIAEKENVEKLVFIIIFSSPCTVEFLQFDSTVYVVVGFGFDNAIYSRSKGVMDFSEFFKALSDKTRVSIIRLLKYGECSQEDISKALSVPLPLLSHHLGVLESFGLIKSVYKSRSLVYSLNLACIERMAEDFRKFTDELQK